MYRTGLVAGLSVMQLVPTRAFGQERAWDWQWNMHPMMLMLGAGGLVMIAIMLVFWGLVIAGLVLGVRWLAGLAQGTGRDEALEILRQRYARGEIDKQEFDTRRRDLGH